MSEAGDLNELINLFDEWLESRADIRNLQELMDAIGFEIASIDHILQDAIRQVARDERFRELESTYRSLEKLLNEVRSDPWEEISGDSADRREVNVFVLDMSADELDEDLAANSHTRSYLFEKLYHKRFNQLFARDDLGIDGYSGIYPFNLIIVDFDFCYPRRETPRRQVDLGVLQKLGRIGEDCFCMFMLAASPQLFGRTFASFAQLESVADVPTIFEGATYKDWNDFRKTDEAKMIGLALPRVLVREPYRNHYLANGGFTFNEFEGFPTDQEDPLGFGASNALDDYLWGNAAYAVVEPIVQSFLKYDWFADTCGIDRVSKTFCPSDESPERGYSGGVIESFPSLSFETETAGTANYHPSDLTVSELDAEMFAELGFIPLYSVNQSSLLATLTFRSVQDAISDKRDYKGAIRLSAMFNYMLCSCRMALRMMIKTRSMLGQKLDSRELERIMQTWLVQFTSGRSRGLNEREMKPFFNELTTFTVEEDPLMPGRFDCVIQLAPHHKVDAGRARIELEPISLEMQLNTEGTSG